MRILNFLKRKEKLATSLQTAVFTTKKIMVDNELITRVYHSSDNYLSFMDNISSNSNENIMIVGLGEILKKDNSIKSVINIPIGHAAYRTRANDKWTIEPFNEDEEEENDN